MGLPAIPCANHMLLVIKNKVINKVISHVLNRFSSDGLKFDVVMFLKT